MFGTTGLCYQEDCMFCCHSLLLNGSFDVFCVENQFLKSVGLTTLTTSKIKRFCYPASTSVNI